MGEAVVEVGCGFARFLNLCFMTFMRVCNSTFGDVNSCVYEEN